MQSLFLEIYFLQISDLVFILRLKYFNATFQYVAIHWEPPGGLAIINIKY